MKKGEKGILIGIGVITLAMMLYQEVVTVPELKKDRGIPFYSTASKQVQREASDLYRKYQCRDCHSLWGIKNVMQSVPAPSLDGMGSLRSEEWLYKYFSAENPQDILPSRLKARYRMPSFAHLPEEERRLLAKYFASLKVEDWYLDETKKSAQTKLTGKD